jgi:hypothetical protein
VSASGAVQNYAADMMTIISEQRMSPDFPESIGDAFIEEDEDE